MRRTLPVPVPAPPSPVPSNRVNSDLPKSSKAFNAPACVNVYRLKTLFFTLLANAKDASDQPPPPAAPVPLASFPTAA